jgi:hypothetical protein
LPEIAGRHPIDIGKPPVRVAAEIEACHEREQAMIDVVGDCKMAMVFLIYGDFQENFGMDSRLN